MKRLSLIAAAAIFTITLPSTGAVARTPASNAHMIETERNRAIMTDFVHLLFVQHDAKTSYEKYVAKDVIEHNPDLTDGRDAAIDMLSKVFGNPDVSFKIERMIVDGDLAAVHVHGQRDPKAKGVAVVNIFRLKDGKIVEHWGVAQPVPETSANPHPMF